nr:oral-facial-digital syndrome 1 protein [Oncorhynchus nerka]
MSVAKEEALSPDELRKRLYQTFKNRGVLDTLKTQLRNQLIHELKHPILSGETVPRPVPMKSDSVLVTASNSLVADHLRNSGYEYTLSVFYPECGMGKDKIFTSRDLLQIMKISPRSPLYKSLASSTQKENKGFLMSLLIELTDRHLHGERRDADTQTTSTPAYRESLVDKMKMIDEEYEALRYKGDKWVSYESKLAAYRTEVEAQVQAEMNAKLQHYKDVEMSKVKMEEKDKSRKEILLLRQDMERTYEMKSGALINREKNAIDRLQKQQEIEEKDVYMQRQAVLKEIETVRNREAELRLRMEAFEKTCKIQEDKTKTMEELLRRRELAVKMTEDTYDQKLKNELSRYQLELNEEYTKRTEKLTENEKRNKVETIRMQKESAAIDAKLEEHSRACAELRRLQMELDTSQSQYSLLTQQNELLRERLETMNDYPTLRRERVEQQAQLRLLMKQLEEAQEENQRLRADLGRPSVEQLALQTELRRLESARRLSEEEFDSHRQVLQAQLHNEVERCAQLKAQLIDCEERTQWMTTHAEDIKMQLRQTQLALENEVLRNPKPSLVDRSVLELNPDKLVPPDIYVDRGVLRAWVAGYDDVCEAGVMPSQGRRSRWGRSSSPDSDAELVAGAKARIRELEKEAETLEEAYRNYQQRAVHATVSHMLPPRCLSPQRAPVSPRPHSTQRQHISHQRPRSPQRQQVPPQPCPHSPQHPQVSHRPPSPQHQPPPQRTRAPASPQPRVTFAEDPSQDQYPGPGSGRDFQSLDFSEARFSGDRHPLEGTSSPHRRLSSTPLSLSRSQLHTEPVEEAEVSSVAFPVLSPERQLSPLPLPRGEVACSGDFTSDLSPPRSPQLRSTARGQCSPPQVQQIIFSSSESESSPQPEKITIEDLTEPLPEPSHIPELLLDTAGNEEEALDGPLTVPPSRAPWDLTEAQLQGEVQQTLDEPARQEEEEELRWERERGEREEKRQRDKEEAQEKELRELERLEKERLLEEVQQYGEEVGGDEEKEERRGQEELKEAEEPEEKAPSSDKDPLQKYLKMIMEQRRSPHVQIPAGREEPEHRSPEAKSLSDEKDDSVAFSHEDADEFW